MKVQFTEGQLKYIINEIEGTNNNIALQLMRDPNNEIVWRCFSSDTQKSIFENGYTSEYFGDGEGSMYGDGVYAFFRPYGCQKRVGTGGVGNKIMKCVVLGGFKDFLIFDSRLATKYYGNDDIRTQFRYFFPKMDPNKLYEECKVAASREPSSVVMSNGSQYERTAPMARNIFSTQRGKYKHMVLASKCRGIVYNGGNDPNALVLFNPREIVPIAVTNERFVDRKFNDFLNWSTLVTDKLVDKIETMKDYYSIGNRLINQHKIRSFTKATPEYDCLCVKMLNGKDNLYNIAENKFISNVGFDYVSGWENSSRFGIMYLPVIINKEEYYIVKTDDGFVICTSEMDNKCHKYKSLADYDKEGIGEKQQLNEELERNGDVVVYHRTDNLNSLKGIFDVGFKKEYFSYGQFGIGIYAALTKRGAYQLRDHYGNYMIKAKVKNGFYGFLIFEQNLARKIYGQNYLIQDQLKLLIPKEFLNELIHKYGNKIYNDYILRDLQGRNGIGELGKTKIRGVITPNYLSHGELIIIVRDWSSLYPLSYSTDDGATFSTRMPKTEGDVDIQKLHGKISSHPDAKFVLANLISTGVIENPFEAYNGSSDLMNSQEFDNGFFEVTLAKTKKVTYFSTDTDSLISTRGFDESYGITDIGGGNAIITVLINGQKYIIRKDKHGSYNLYTTPKQQLAPLLTVDDYDEEFKNGNLSE